MSDWGFQAELWHVVGNTGEPAFTNGWVNYDTTNYDSASFFKDVSGVVRLKGKVKSGTAGTSVFTLPVGYRPLHSIYIAVCAQNPGNLVGVATLGADGTVGLPSGLGNTFVSLDGVWFRAEG